MKVSEIEEAIEREVAEWPGAGVSFAQGGKHRKAKLTYGELIVARAYTSSNARSTAIRATLGDIRRALKSMGAERAKPEPSAAEDEAAYAKANEGREKRPDPVEREPVEPKPGLTEQLDLASESGAIPKPAPKPAAPPPKPEPAPKPSYPADVADGVYFGMPEDAYHAIERASCSGMQRMMVSPADFWADSWLNPNPPKLTPEQQASREKARMIGDAYHKARLEPELFEQLYCRQISKADMPEGTLFTGDDMKGALAELGLAVSGKVAEQAQRLRDAGYDGPIWQDELARWESERGGRIPIPAETFDEIIVDMERLRQSETIAKRLTGGQAEVSIFWTCPRGLKRKCRLDYLTAEFWTDIKTFANINGKNVVQAINDAFRYNRYHVQPVWYRDGVEQIRVGGLQIVGPASDEQRKLIAEIQMRPAELDCWYVFIQKGGIPNIFARRFVFFQVPLNQQAQHAGASAEGVERVEAATRTRTAIHSRAVMDIEGALRDLDLYSRVYRPGEPWVPIEQEGTIDDYDFSPGWLEGKWG